MSDNMFRLTKGKNGSSSNGVSNPDELIRAIKNPNEADLIRVACALMIENNHLPNIFGLFNKEKTWYELPGGKYNNDGYIKGTLRREVEEELGMDIQIDDNRFGRYVLPVGGIDRIFDVYFCRYDIRKLPSKPKEKEQFPYYSFIPMLDVMSEKRIDVSPLIFTICKDLIPPLKEEGIDLEKLYK